jgi:hypothetical protein
MNLKNGKVFTSKFVGTGSLSYKKRIYRASVSQRLRNTALNVSHAGIEPGLTMNVRLQYKIHITRHLVEEYCNVFRPVSLAIIK